MSNNDNNKFLDEMLNAIAQWWDTSWLHTIIFIRSELNELNAKVDNMKPSNIQEYNQNYQGTTTTGRDYSKDFESMQRDINKLEKTLDSLINGANVPKGTTNTDLKNQLIPIVERINELKDTVNSSKNEIATLKSTIQKDQQEISYLKSTVQKNEQDISELKSMVNSLISSQVRTSDTPMKKIITTPTPTPTPTPRPVATPVDETPKAVAPQNSIFSITGNENTCPLDSNTTPDSVKRYFNTALNMESMLRVANSNKQLSSYINNLNIFKNKLTHAIEKFEKNKLYQYTNVEELSEDATELVHKQVSSEIIGNIITSIGRKLSNNNPSTDIQALNKMLVSINRYLAGLGYYTKNVQVGEKLNPVRSDMELIPEPCSDEKLHEVVKSVDRLPYYINCCGCNSPLICNGTYTVYSSKI